MAVTNVHILYVGTTAYDLRKVESWNVDPDDATKLRVRFISDQLSIITIAATTFEAAKQASIDAETP